MRCGFRPRDRDRTTDGMEGVLDGLFSHFGVVLDRNTHEAFSVPRLTFGVTNEVQMAQNLTDGLPVVNQGRLASLGPIRERLTPAHEKRQKGGAGGDRSAGLRNGQWGKCSDA